MSDFLSKFSGKHYDDLLAEDAKHTGEDLGKKRDLSGLSDEEDLDPGFIEEARKRRALLKAQAEAEKAEAEKALAESQEVSKPDPQEDAKPDLEEADLEEEGTSLVAKATGTAAPEVGPASLPLPANPSRKSQRRQESFEETEVDPTYQDRKKKQRMAAIGAGLLGLLLVFFIYFQLSHVKVPDFVGKDITEARTWAANEKITLQVNQEFSSESDANVIISQSTPAGKNMAKGKTLTLVASKGADPEEVIGLPSFETMTASQMEDWIATNKATNLKILKEYSDTIPAGDYIRSDLNGVTSADYKRGDRATLYYSNGKESLEKNINVPDFVGKAKSEVDSWARTNGVDINYINQASSTVAQGSVIAQGVAAGDKVAKKDKIDITLSAGKGVTVPDFKMITPDLATSVNGLTPIIKYQYSDTVPYGSLIYQSIEAGKQLAETDDKTLILIYSQGQPYLRDLRGKNEGDLQKYVFDEFDSKGATLTYYTYYVDSDQPRGTVVEQSARETLIPLNFELWLGISNGAYADETAIPSQGTDVTSEASQGTDQGVGE